MEKLEEIKSDKRSGIERFVDTFPEDVARGIRILLKDYREGKVNREQVYERWNKMYDDQIETALNTIDAAEDRLERIPKAE